jgi:Polyketide cyclase / dehydrase and lipid transport
MRIMGGERMQIAPAWECQRSVEADVPASFAWEFMTDIRNWSDPPAEFALDGPFAAGARGTTLMPGQPPMSWTIRDVEPGRAYTIEGSFLDGTQCLAYWQFDPLPDDRTKLTQRLELHGENAAAHVGPVSAAFEPNLEPGLRRIAGLMAQAASAGSDRRADL